MIKKNFDLTRHNTFRISAKAQYFVMVKNQDELVAALNWTKEKKLRVHILAGGSNVLMAVKIIKGLVIKISGEEYSVKGSTITAWAGTGLTKLAKIAEAHSLTGLEWAYGIPGQLGGAVRGDTGAYGSSISRVVEYVEAYDYKKSKFVSLNNRACKFSYKHSVFVDKKNLLVISVKLKLTAGNKAEIKKLAAANFSHRSLTKPKAPSAGSVFKNLSYAEVAKANKSLAIELAGKSMVKGGKIPAAYLIDQANLKGKTRGGAKVSEKHANFIINFNNAKAEDIIGLINLIKIRIKNKFKINLIEEIQYFGK